MKRICQDVRALAQVSTTKQCFSGNEKQSLKNKLPLVGEKEPNKRKR